MMTLPAALTPDGTRYIALASGERAPSPFYLRWLIPKLCGRSPLRWFAVGATSSIGAAVGIGMLAPSLATGIAAALMFAGLPIVAYNLQAPILVDMPALALAVWAGVAGRHELIWLAVLLACLSGAAKESGPVFSAVFATSFWPLLALAPVAVRALMARTGPDPISRYRTVNTPEEHAWILAHPFRAGWKYHRRKLFDGTVMLAPWGGALAGLANLDAWTIAALCLGYGQLAVATDSVRLYQWAAPMLIIAAVTAVPVAWLPVLVAATVWNPLAGDGC